MARRIANTQLNGRTIDILNVIRQNASYAYQSQVPEIADVADIPHVGEILYGNPTLNNEFINSLVNRIALVLMSSATFNNPYADLKKGYIEYGETVEEIFTKLAKVIEYSAEKASAREFKRTIPDVRTAFHTVNWRVLYPVTIQKQDLRKAFLSESGVENLIADIIGQVYTAVEYDEFLLFKYLMIKAVTQGKMRPIAVNMADVKNSAIAFRGASNKMEFMLTDYNESHVLTNTPKSRQHIFMDSEFNAQFDVEVLASAFNMERADFMGRLRLIDDFTTFDNSRWEEIRANSDGLEAVNDAELELLADVKAILVDENWFQIYDYENEMTETQVASGLYWNYFYHVWKIVSNSPFANAVVFVDVSSSALTTHDTMTLEVIGKVDTEESTIFDVVVDVDATNFTEGDYQFIQTQEAVTKGVAVKPEGSFILPPNSQGITVELVSNGVHYKSVSGSNVITKLTPSVDVGDTITLYKQS